MPETIKEIIRLIIAIVNIFVISAIVVMFLILSVFILIILLPVAGLSFVFNLLFRC
jgi:hypothetical protein